jgi:hypothetical protein
MSSDQKQDLIFNGKIYRWSDECDVLTWADSGTNVIAPAKVTHQLNRQFLDEHAESLFESWGREDLPRIVRFLKTHGGTQSDYDRIKIGHLFDTSDSLARRGESPIHALGYHVGKNGLDEQVRRKILNDAFVGDLTNVGPPEFMARWGFPRTQTRLSSIIAQIRSNFYQIRQQEADYSKAEAEWNADLDWLKTFEVSHSLDGLVTDTISKATSNVADVEYFSPESLKDERERKLQEIVQRRGQPDFRNNLIVAYGGRCAITECDALAALEAAHIVPYSGPQSNHVTNGLLLRADIHTLFDLDLIGINPESLIISVAAAIATTVYADLEGQKLILPASSSEGPNQEALANRWKRFCGKKEVGE